MEITAPRSRIGWMVRSSRSLRQFPQKISVLPFLNALKSEIERGFALFDCKYTDVCRSSPGKAGGCISVDRPERDGASKMQMIVPRQVSRNAATVLRNAPLGGGAVWPAARQTILVLVAAFVMCLPFAQGAYAQSAGCNAINATWGGGVNLSNGNDLWQYGLSVLAGETLTYSAVTSGTATPNSAGFAIYQNDGLAPSDILLEQYSSPGAELNLNNTLSIPEDDDRFILYAWSDPAGGTVQVTVTCAGKSDQTITFNNPGAQNFGTSPTLTASATSGLTPTLSSATTGICTITSGGVLNFVTAGSCTINANQAGNASYNAATQVQQTFTVNAVAPGQPTI
ncbi:MAG: Ig-like domain-containing protein, partial [Rhizobium sp.]|nr:Ig-like domain-containing protein [Rhizobium sp.]